MNIDKYQVDNNGGDYAFQYVTLYNDKGEELSPSKIYGSDYQIGAISNQTGVLKNLELLIGPDTALYVMNNGENVEMGQKGTFDLELTNASKGTFKVTFHVTISGI